MFELCPILTRVEIDGSVPAGMSNVAASMLGFFSIRIAIDSVFGMLLLTPTGTTAPFSAMSGVWKKTMSLLCTGSPPPSAFIVSARLWVSNAALFHVCACAAPGASSPAPPSSESSVAPLPVFNIALRLGFIDLLRKFQAAFYAFAAEKRLRPLAPPAACIRCRLTRSRQNPFDDVAGIRFGQLRLRGHGHRAPRSAASVPDLGHQPRQRCGRPCAGVFGPIALGNIPKRRTDDRGRDIVTRHAAGAPRQVDSRAGARRHIRSRDGGLRRRSLNDATVASLLRQIAVRIARIVRDFRREAHHRRAIVHAGDVGGVGLAVPAQKAVLGGEAVAI